MNHCVDQTREAKYGSPTSSTMWLAALCGEDSMVNNIHFAEVFIGVVDQCPACLDHPELPMLLLGSLP